MIGLVAQQYWFLRETETSLHGFTRIAYNNDTVPHLAVLTELRTLFRPHGPLFTHMSSTKDFYVPQPKPNPAVDAKNDLGIATLVQDTTWYLANRTGDPYVEQVADYWTKYALAEVYRDHTAHGVFADGSGSPDGSTYGAWMVYNSKDTFYGGPTFSDLTTDGLVYNYIQSNHHGDQPPNITHGFDRTWGPSIYHFNRGDKVSGKDGVAKALSGLRYQAEKLADISQHAKFYDDIATHVTGYVPTSGRGTWRAKINLPKGAKNPIAVLSAPGLDFQDNAMDTAAYQYWANVENNGKVEIGRVKAGIYRLTLYADGIFGDFVVSENIVVGAGQVTETKKVDWVPESAGTELWRIGTPDKSSGEFRHGYTLDTSRASRPPQYRLYWGTYDFIDEFPQGVNFHVGKSKIDQDWNSIHWAAYGSSMTRPGIFAGGKISNWTVTFDVGKNDLKKKTQATLSVQFAGVTTESGNTDIFNPNSPWANLDFNVIVNGNRLKTHVIP
jgi:rhamnogalacturonan endolyase